MGNCFLSKAGAGARRGARKPDLPVQEIIEAAPSVDLGIACNAVENAEMCADAPILRGSIDRRTFWAGKHYGDRLRRAVHRRSSRPDSQPSHFGRACHFTFALSPSSTRRPMGGIH